ncbi:hypothetical protein LINPERPRIM_LOCUS22354 [Linum perenne]
MWSLVIQLQFWQQVKVNLLWLISSLNLIYMQVMNMEFIMERKNLTLI